MSLSVRGLAGPLVALTILAVIGFQTSDALRRSGLGSHRRPVRAMAQDPYSRLEAELAKQGDGPDLTGMRDPFTYGPARVEAEHTRARARVVAPPPQPQPILTAIFADADPRALIRYEEKNYAVKPGELFADLKVISISADLVILDRRGERIVLHRPTKGD